MNRHPRIVVVGDSILDVYLHGSYSRSNPEGDGQVFLVQRAECRAGGAAAVARLCHAMGAEVLLLGSIGRDEHGRRLKTILDQAGLVRATDYGSYETTVKTRRVCAGRLLPGRVDWDATWPINDHDAEDLVQCVRKAKADAILVSDYGKGTCTPAVLRGLEAAHGDVPILVDPAKGSDWQQYPAGCTIKANRHEFVAYYKHATPGQRMFCGPLVVTSREWIAWTWSLHDDLRQVPTIDVAERLVDATGCGDTVLAVLGLCAARSIPLEDACRLAVRAAAIQAQQIGVHPIMWEEFADENGIDLPTQDYAAQLPPQAVAEESPGNGRVHQRLF